MALFGLITQKQYAEMVAAFRETPGAYGPVAKRMNLDPRTVRRGWLLGWPKMGSGWARPIKDVLAEEQQTARSEAVIEAARAKQAASVPADAMERARAELAAIDWHVKEGQLAHAAIVNASGLMEIVNRLLTAAVPLAKRVTEAIATEKFSAAHGAQLLARVTNLAETAGRTAKAAVELERLHLGQPGQIVGVQDAGPPMSIEAAAKELADGHRTLMRAARRGLVALPAGVEYEPPPGSDGKTDAA